LSLPFGLNPFVEAPVSSLLNGRMMLAVSVGIAINKGLRCLIYEIVLTAMKSLKVSDVCHCPLAWLP
jgi:hypothetical protein